MTPISTRTGRAAVMVAASKPLEIHEYPLPVVPADGVLVKVRCCTICRSDLHTWTGRRAGPTPAILGHEIVGQIVELGSSVKKDASDRVLRLGDRVTWTLHSSCGKCYFCSVKQLPMKCEQLKKYGHDACDQPPHFAGGFAEYCLLDAGTRIFKLPENLPDVVAAPANCAVATIVAGWDAANLKAGQNVLIQGAGALGCYACAFAAYAGCAQIIVTDVDAGRLEMVRSFGATAVIDVSEMSATEMSAVVKKLTGGMGADCAMEVAGQPGIIPAGLASLCKGGTYIEIGCSFPGAMVNLDMSLILWNLLTLRGVHNYDARHLRDAIDFLAATITRFDYRKLSTASYSLDEINLAIERAEQKESIRVAVVP